MHLPAPLLIDQRPWSLINLLSVLYNSFWRRNAAEPRYVF